MNTILDPELCWRVLLTLGHNLVNLFQRVAEALLFFHPPVWLVSRRSRIEREHCCDDAVVAAGCEPLVYAESLVTQAKRALAARAGRCPAATATALYADGGSGDLRSRVARILKIPGGGEVRLRRVWPLALGSLVALSIATIWAVEAQLKNEQDPSKREAIAAAPKNITDPPAKTAVPIASLLNRPWKELQEELSAKGIIPRDERETSPKITIPTYILSLPGKGFGKVRIVMNNGVVDQVEVWDGSGLPGFTSKVAGVIGPGADLTDVEKAHGQPIYVVNGKEGQWCKVWQVDDYVVAGFRDISEGEKIESVWGYRIDALPPPERLLPYGNKEGLLKVLKTLREKKTAGGVAAQPAADSATMVAEALERIHKRVAALEGQHPALKGIADAKPLLGGDTAFTRRVAYWKFANNATALGKARPSVTDPSKAFCWINLTMWIRSTESLQPPAYQHTYHIGGIEWLDKLEASSDDAKLVESFEAIVAEELDRFTRPLPPAAPATAPAAQPAVEKQPTEKAARRAGGLKKTQFLYVEMQYFGPEPANKIGLFLHSDQAKYDPSFLAAQAWISPEQCRKIRSSESTTR